MTQLFGAIMDVAPFCGDNPHWPFKISAQRADAIRQQQTWCKVCAVSAVFVFQALQETSQGDAAGHVWKRSGETKSES